MNNDIKAQELSIVCILSDRDRLERQTTIAIELFTNFQQFRELNEGYAFSIYTTTGSIWKPFV